MLSSILFCYVNISLYDNGLASFIFFSIWYYQSMDIVVNIAQNKEDKGLQRDNYPATKASLHYECFPYIVGSLL